MISTRKTVADMRGYKGRRPITMLYVETIEEAEAATAAGIDMLSIPAERWNPKMRAAAGGCFVQVALLYGHYCTGDEYLRGAHRVLLDGGDCVYCCPSLRIVESLSAEGIPVVGHVGLIPARATWTGGFKAVGKTAESAVEVFRQVKALEAAGAFAAEIEVVPESVAAEISKRTSLLMLSMGAGAGCDAQYLFAEDVLGYTRGHRPRHAKVYRDFRAEHARLQAERVQAFREYAQDVISLRYPAAQHKVAISEADFDSFMLQIDNWRAGGETAKD